MTETPARYRILDRPGPDAALIEAPDGAITLWWLAELPIGVRRCAQCERRMWRFYRLLSGAGLAGPCLCRPCVEGTPGVA